MTCPTSTAARSHAAAFAFFRALLTGSTTPSKARRSTRAFVAGLLAAATLTACGGGDTSAVQRLTGRTAQPTANAQPANTPAPLPTPTPHLWPTAAPTAAPVQPAPAPQPTAQPQTLAVIPTPYTQPDMPNVEPYPVPATGCTKNAQGAQGVWECEP